MLKTRARGEILNSFRGTRKCQYLESHARSLPLCKNLLLQQKSEENATDVFIFFSMAGNPRKSDVSYIVWEMLLSEQRRNVSTDANIFEFPFISMERTFEKAEALECNYLKWQRRFYYSAWKSRLNANLLSLH